MRKHYQKALFLFSLVALLLTACTANTDEPVEQVKAGPPVKPVEAVSEVQPQDCVLKPPKQPVACTMQYDPVCGCDGKTYGNACSARAAGVPHSTPGACGKDPNT